MGCFSGKEVVSLTDNKIKPEFKNLKHMKEASAATFVKIIKGNQLLDDYFLLKTIGHGSFGEVRLAKHKSSGEERAIKFVKKSGLTELQLQEMAREHTMLKALDHPNIVSMFEFYEEENHYALVQEYCRGGDLFDHVAKVKKFTEAKGQKFIKVILGAINYCHLQRIIHRDLKPENILLEPLQDAQTLKIIDFGCSAIKVKKFWTLEDKLNKEFVGTAEYMAPEVINGGHDEKCDIWSIGVIAFVLLSGKYPFAGQNEAEFFKAVCKEKVNFPLGQWGQISQGAKDFISKCLEKDPKKRLSAQNALRHPWISTIKSPVANQTEVLINLTTFKAKEQMKQAVFAYIGSQLLGKKEKNRLAKVFQQLDVQKKGKLNLEDLRKGFEKHTSRTMTDKEAHDIFDHIDIDGGGDLSYSEFMTAALDKTQLLTEDRLKKAFQLFDKDNSGTISKLQIAEVFGWGDSKEYNDRVTEIIQEMDLDGDGLIQYEEFKRIMLMDEPLTPNRTQIIKKLPEK